MAVAAGISMGVLSLFMHSQGQHCALQCCATLIGAVLCPLVLLGAACSKRSRAHAPRKVGLSLGLCW